MWSLQGELHLNKNDGNDLRGCTRPCNDKTGAVIFENYNNMIEYYDKIGENVGLEENYIPLGEASGAYTIVSSVDPAVLRESSGFFIGSSSEIGSYYKDNGQVTSGQVLLILNYFADSPKENVDNQATAGEGSNSPDACNSHLRKITGPCRPDIC